MARGKVEQFDGVRDGRTVVFTKFSQLDIAKYRVGGWNAHGVLSFES